MFAALSSCERASGPGSLPRALPRTLAIGQRETGHFWEQARACDETAGATAHDQQHSIPYMYNLYIVWIFILPSLICGCAS